jgi:hypothetical protein
MSSHTEIVSIIHWVSKKINKNVIGLIREDQRVKVNEGCFKLVK